MFINNIEFASQRLTTEGTIDLAQFERVINLLDDLSGNISYKLVGDVDKAKRCVLKLTIYGKISALCQVCLNKMDFVINHKGLVAIFNSEPELDEALFGEDSIYADGIVADSEFNVLNFIEDELIMLLPVAPRHDQCNLSYKDEVANPFGVLKISNIN